MIKIHYQKHEGRFSINDIKDPILFINIYLSSKDGEMVSLEKIQLCF